MIEFVLGGARAGKSAYAERRAHESSTPVTWIVTAQARDAEMAARIAVHRARRPANCDVVEEPLYMAAALDRIRDTNGLVVVDCLTIWVANLIEASDALLEREIESFIQIINNLTVTIIVISNEVGMGIVPENALARRYRDELGRLNQRVAARADRVLLMTAGLPLVIKEFSHARR